MCKMRLNICFVLQTLRKVYLEYAFIFWSHVHCIDKFDKVYEKSSNVSEIIEIINALVKKTDFKLNQCCFKIFVKKIYNL